MLFSDTSAQFRPFSVLERLDYTSAADCTTNLAKRVSAPVGWQRAAGLEMLRAVDLILQIYTIGKRLNEPKIKSTQPTHSSWLLGDLTKWPEVGRGEAGGCHDYFPYPYEF